MAVARVISLHFFPCTICVPLKSHGLSNKAPFIRSLLNSLNQVSIEHDRSSLKPLTYVLLTCLRHVLLSVEASEAEDADCRWRHVGVWLRA